MEFKVAKGEKGLHAKEVTGPMGVPVRGTVEHQQQRIDMMTRPPMTMTPMYGATYSPFQRYGYLPPPGYAMPHDPYTQHNMANFHIPHTSLGRPQDPVMIQSGQYLPQHPTPQYDPNSQGSAHPGVNLQPHISNPPRPWQQ